MILTNEEIESHKKKAKIEIDRPIKSVKAENREITINGKWTTSYNKNISLERYIVEAIEEYCSVENMEWEKSINHPI